MRSDHSAENIYVRSEPTMATGRKEYKPDIVVFNRIKPIYFVEIKFLQTSRNLIDLDRRRINQDLIKLEGYAKRCPSFKQGFLVCVYDADDVYEINMNEYDGILLAPINLKRGRNGRLRKNYNPWRRKFDALREVKSYGATRLILFGSGVETPMESRDVDPACDDIPGWGLYEFAAGL